MLRVSSIIGGIYFISASRRRVVAWARSFMGTHIAQLYLYAELLYKIISALNLKNSIHLGHFFVIQQPLFNTLTATWHWNITVRRENTPISYISYSILLSNLIQYFMLFFSYIVGYFTFELFLPPSEYPLHFLFTLHSCFFGKAGRSHIEHFVLMWADRSYVSYGQRWNARMNSKPCCSPHHHFFFTFSQAWSLSFSGQDIVFSCRRHGFDSRKG